MSQSDNLTILLNQWIDGNLSIEDKLISEIYPMLRDVAHKQLKNKTKSNIFTTVIVNELYLKLKQQNRIHLQNRNHFFAFSARLARQIVIDLIRSENSLKRGLEYQQITLDNDVISDGRSQSQIDWLAINQLLQELENIDPDSVKLIELRFFAGLTIPEIAEVLKTSTTTISRNWKFAKSWLFNQLKNDY